MVEIREIVCPIDFSNASRRALEHATVIAGWYKSRITALYVIHTPLFPTPPILVAGFAEPTAPVVPDRAASEKELRSWLEPATRAGLKTDVLVLEGNTTALILEQASVRNADLVVMGTQGLGGVDRFMLGSVAETVLRKAACPVMTVPPTAAGTANVPYKRLLCPVDFSESSLAALRFAFSLAKEADANLTIMHVLDFPAEDELLVESFDTPAFRRVVEGEARSRLEALVPEDVRVWSRPSTKIAYGKPYRQILETAAAERTDLIVIGVRGRKPLDLALFGSTTNHIVRRAPCPVLTLRE